MAIAMTTEPEMTPEHEAASKHWGGLVFFILTLLALGYGIYQLSEAVADREVLPIAQLKIIGERRFTTDQEIRGALESGAGLDSLMMQDVAHVQRRVVELPWVDAVQVRKSWPDGLTLFITEQQPLAQWDEGRLLNQRGELFTVPEPALAEPLPLLQGPDGTEQRVLDYFKRFDSLLAYHQLELLELTMSTRQAWKLLLAPNLELRLGREDEIARLQRFIDLYQALPAEAKNKIAYVDARYDTGMAVGWLTENDTE
ncbi:cell division protein DivIVA [Corallincola holothuriorum]|uniref:Cell division protein FtsQ n=1 Tax=Corallincola holothuriorum TaxID=2282215 RepID=A0A368NHF1_9GAMM|nr:cell division protein FtsQ/DivIB [Corallincola holothuriorum]RCU49888.1 cell division protein DivIVA [Corallincola holothuriorum]